MRKFLLTITTLVTLAFCASAVTYMRVHTNDGKIVKYDVENVSLVDYEEEIISVDTTTIDTTKTLVEGVTVSGKVGKYTFVDLGLPSGTKWATYNVGASKPTDYGDYFAWGETSTKEDYTWKTYKWCDGSYDTQTKYCVDSRYSSTVTVDSLSTLLTDDDAAIANWGKGWRMPSPSELYELITGCEWKWTDDFNGSGIAGQIGTSKVNGNIIFLPAAGYYSGHYLNEDGKSGAYWSSSFSESLSSSGINLSIDSATVYRSSYGYRSYGLSVRAVVSDSTVTEVKDVTITGKVGNYTYVDLGLESGTKWATCNVGATQPTEYGDYFAWGETSPNKENYEWSTYKWCDGSYDSQTKYCTDSDFGTTDKQTTLLAEDDAATQNWSAEWRMPTSAEQLELLNGCNWVWTSDFNESGVGGFIGTSKSNGNTIFLPAAGLYTGTKLNNAGVYGNYWSSSLDKNDNDLASNLNVTSSSIDWGSSMDRFVGQSVRAVVNE